MSQQQPESQSHHITTTLESQPEPKQSTLPVANQKNKRSQSLQKISQYIDASKQKLASRLTMEGLLKQARISLENYLNPKLIPLEQKFSRDMLIGAQGIVFITEMKAGFVFGASGGSGIMLCRDRNGNWSGPCAVGMGGMSWGFSAGISKVDHIIILPTIHHVRTFMASDSLQIHANVEACVVDIGRNANVGYGISQHAASPVISYSFSTKGLYGGFNIEGAIIAVRHSCNENFYNRKVSIEDIATGNISMIQPNENYQKIICLLNNYCEAPSTAVQTSDNQNNNNINNNNNDNNNNNNNNNNVTMPPQTQQMSQPIMHEKPPLVRQNEVSPNFIVKNMD